VENPNQQERNLGIIGTNRGHRAIRRPSKTGATRGRVKRDSGGMSMVSAGQDDGDPTNFGLANKSGLGFSSCK